ncbi:MAG: hypothetical protein HYT42_00900 [Candidatus Sungbacteria bacterium]|uniref:Transcriptional repressor PaaX-like central Cas2-like domain-containing protein n=1 Tax=Candidatus Sungiibacteriota bacterium TaxID=2750080 RepID=A0A932YXI0_9BACT|nr:hypothetical protein [Candidatus Sungbacteria bacterium]MBI4132096.1 hypothetical protein [Candidatus Sungbacteria bacterium]
MPIARRFIRVVPRAVRPSLTQLILDKVGGAGEALLDSFFPAKYPEARLWRKLLGLDRTYEFKRPTFIAILFQLRAQGLVERAPKRGRWYWRPTAAGRAALTKRRRSTPPPDGRKRLVCFDIPERDRAKRQWLRGELIAAGYHQLQKSVWIGTTPLPQELVEALDALGLRGRVHLLRVESEGTLNERRVGDV